MNLTNRQTGAVLIVSLLMLMVMTLIGVTAMQSNLLQEKMAGNFRNRNVAFQATEMALRDGERLIQTNSPAFTSRCNEGLCNETNDIWKTIDWNNDNKIIEFGNPNQKDIAIAKQDPVYLIERLHTLPSRGNSIVQGFAPLKTKRYRITARGTDGTGSAEVILQSVYEK